VLIRHTLSAAKLLTLDEARRIAVSVAKATGTAAAENLGEHPTPDDPSPASEAAASSLAYRT
jgi:hypothetical protein